MVKPANKFVRGSSVYTCRCCGRKTRQTGRGDNEHLDLCAECYDLGGIDNAFHDGDGDDAYAEEAARLYKLILQKGGTPKFDNMLAISHLLDPSSTGTDNSIAKVAHQQTEQEIQMSKIYKTEQAAKTQAKKLHGENWGLEYVLAAVEGGFALEPISKPAEELPDAPVATELDTSSALQEMGDSVGESNEPPVGDDAAPIVQNGFGALVASVMGNGSAPAPEAPKQGQKETGRTIEQNRPEQNGLKRPTTGSTCEIIWRTCDEITAKKGSPATSGELFAALQGYNECTLRTQYARWRQYNGITGRLPGQGKGTVVKNLQELSDVKDILLTRIPQDKAEAIEALNGISNADDLVLWLAKNLGSI